MEAEPQQELTSSFIESISSNLLLNDDLSLIPISSADDSANAIYEYDLEQIPEELVHLKQIIENEKFEKFTFDEHSLRSLKGILILIGDNKTQLAIYKHHFLAKDIKALTV